MSRSSEVMITMVVAGGFLGFLIIFIFGKRQIMRFALRFKRGPHFPVGQGAKKTIRREIERKIDTIQKIVYEPKLLTNEEKIYILPPSQNSVYPSGLYCRQRAVDDIIKLEAEISKYDKSTTRRPSENLRGYLLNVLAVPHSTVSQRTIHQFCDLYEQARFDPNEFTEEDYRTYYDLLRKLIGATRLLKPIPNLRKPSPSRTLSKKSTQEKFNSNIDGGAGDKVNTVNTKDAFVKGETPV